MFQPVVVGGEEQVFFSVKRILFRVKPENAERHLSFSSLSACDVQCLACFRGELPDVILVINKDRFILLYPACSAVAGDFGRIVMILVEKRNFDVRCQVSRRACGSVIKMPVLISIIKDIAPACGKGESVFQAGCNFFTQSIPDVDQVDVIQTSVPGPFFLIGNI